MRIAICEDLASDATKLRVLLSRYLEEYSLQADIDCFESGEAFLEAFSPGKYQIIFMDIYMMKNGLTGMQTAEKIRETEHDAAIILITTSLEHSIAGYKVAVYYILKPVEYGELQSAMGKCQMQLARFARTIGLLENRQQVKVRLREIYFIEAQQRACVLTTATGVIRTNISIEALNEKLGGFPFLRCHKSFIINLVHVADMLEKDFEMTNGARVPISRTYQTDSHAAFGEYFRAKVRGETV